MEEGRNPAREKALIGGCVGGGVVVVIGSVVSFCVLIRRMLKTTNLFAFKKQGTPHDPSNSTATTMAGKDVRSSETSGQMKDTGLEKSIKTEGNISYSMLPADGADGEEGCSAEEYHEYDVPTLELMVQPSEYETPMETSVQVVQNVYETINDEEDKIYEEIK